MKNWVQDYRDEQKKAKKQKQNELLTATEYKKLYEKERRSKVELEEENGILKKAMHIFTQGTE